MKKETIMNKLISLGLLCIIALSSCAKYTPRPLHMSQGMTQTQENVSVSAHTLSELDCQYYFSRRTISKGYRAIQLSIVNTSDSDYILDAHSITLQVEPISSVAKNLHVNTAKRVVTWLIPSLFIWPFIIPSAVDGVKSHDANKALDSDFEQRVIGADSRIRIPARKTINKVLFVTTENFEPNFEFRLENRELDKLLIFDVTI